MLRFSFLPCDFHPLLLVLGETGDLAEFADWLRRFADMGADQQLEKAAFAAPGDTHVALTRSGGEHGLWLIDKELKRLRWTLDRRRTAEFVDMVQGLANPVRKSGSEMLICEVLGEIPIKVSRGEFTDNFLLTLRP